VTLADARQWYLGLGPAATPEQRRTALNALTYEATVAVQPNSRLDAMTFRIHAQCMLGTLESLNTLLKAYVEEMGTIVVSLLINRRIMTTPGGTGGGLGVGAMLCAASWNSSPSKLRLLYAYGGRVDEVDERGLYLEEALPSFPYFNHIANCRGGGASPVARRQAADFQDVVQEIERLAGEREPGPNWHPPSVVLEVPADLVPR